METQQLKELNNRIDVLSKSVDEIRNAILGDDFNPIGYQKRMDNVENRLGNVEDFIKKWKWILAGALGLGGYGGLTFIEQVIDLVSKAINKH